MNINRLNNRWPVTCRDSLTAIDRMGVSTALELGLITKEESDAITDAFVMNLTILMVFCLLIKALIKINILNKAEKFKRRKDESFIFRKFSLFCHRA